MTLAGSGHRLEPRRLPPPSKALGAELAVLLGGEEVPARTEVVAEGAEGLQEALRVLRRFEALKYPFSFPDRPVRVLRPIVEALVPSVLGIRQDSLERGWVAGEFVGDHHPGRLVLPGQHAAQEALSRLPVAPLLHKD